MLLCTGVLHGATSSIAAVLLVSKFPIIFDCILLRMNNQQGLSATWDVLNEILQSLINAGVNWLLYQLALDDLSFLLASSVWNKEFRWSNSEFGI